MRILYILTSLGVGGAEKQVVAVAERMAEKGHSTAFIVLKHSDEEWPVKLPVLRLNLRKTPLGIFRGLVFARKFLALFRPDILHSHTFPANVFTRLLHTKFRMGGTAPRVMNTIHNVHEGGWHRMFIYRLTDPLAHRVTAVSAAAAQRFVRWRAVHARKMSVLTNGIDTEFFTPDRSSRLRLRQQMQAGNRFIWLAVGRITPAKDYPNLLRAFAKVRSANPNTRLWIAGEGEFQLDHLDAGEDSGVELLGLRRDIADLLDAADGYVLSSAWEGMPLALGEAMAMEKLAVATDVGGVRELLADTGFVVPANDSDALQAAMLKAMKMAERERRAMGAAARKRIKLHFSISEKAMEWERLYTQVIYDKGQ